MKKILSLIFVFAIGLSAFAQKISVAELSKIIGNDKVVVVDVRKSADYKKTHIKGAVNLDVTLLCDNAPVKSMLKPKSEVASELGKHGISTSKKVVVYCETGVRAGRLYWILDYMGHKDVHMLDGQMDAWFKKRKPITNKVTNPKPVTFTPSINSSVLVNKAYVNSKKSAAGTILIDTRKAEEYSAGHIGNAVNIPHKKFLNKHKIKSNADIKAILSSKGVSKDKEIILYCKTSTTAGLAYFIMKSLLGYSNVKLYDGAWEEWN